MDSAESSDVSLRRFPYPYQAMLAICNDLDETPDASVYEETMRFINTTEPTSMGAGVGLEISNTIYFDMSSDQFAYWNTDDAGRDMVRQLIRSGHIDCLHSYGDLATTRAHAARALDELTRHDCRIEVWVDHSKAASNFGADIMFGSGDVVADEAYHADLTLAYGIEYIWRGRTTSICAQNVRPQLRGILDSEHALYSARTLVKEGVKLALGRVGNTKYEMHASNQLSRIVSLRNGTQTREFLRCNPHWRGVGEGATAAGLGEVLSDRFLSELVSRRGASILYTHWGKIEDSGIPFGPPTVEGFRRLSRYSREGKILVTTTRRVLGYDRARREVTLVARSSDAGQQIEIRTKSPPGTTLRQLPECDLGGLTIYTCDSARARVLVDGVEVANLIVNEPDETGKRSVSLPWAKLQWPRT